MQIDFCTRYRCVATSSAITEGGLQTGRQGALTKTLRIMQLTALLILIACLQVSAHGYSQDISLSFKDAPLDKVFKAIEAQSDYSIIYDVDVLKETKPVSVDLKDVDIKAALDACLQNQPLNYAITNRLISISRKKKFTFFESEEQIVSPPINIKGRLVNEKGEPVVGASIRIRGTNNGTHTNDNGEFELNEVEENATLQISSVNIETFEWKVGGKKELHLKAITKIAAQEEVIISTGYQKIRPERFVGSASVLDSAAFHRRAGMNILDRLDGTVPAVLFNKKAGVSSEWALQIRGISTLGSAGSPFARTSTAPLIIVDNFPYPYDLSTINPNDVESVTVLKDAAASSVWGTRAGNGVIVITTKKGRFNQRFQISLSSNATIAEEPDIYAYPQMNVSDFIDLEISRFNDGAYDAALANLRRRPVVSPVVEIMAQQREGALTKLEADKLLNKLRQQDLRKELQRYVYQRAISQQHHLSFSGGNNNVNYSFMAGYNESTLGIIGSDRNKQNTLTSNINFRPLKNLDVNATVAYNQAENRPSFAFEQGLNRPYLALADESGAAMSIPLNFRESFLASTGGGHLLDWLYRPLDEIKMADNRNTARTLNMNVGANYRITDWLTAGIAYQYTMQFSKTRAHYSKNTFQVREQVNLFTDTTQFDPNLRNPVPIGGILDYGTSEAFSRNLRAQLNVVKNFGLRHSVTALAAFEQGQTESRLFNARFYGYDDELGTYKIFMDYTTAFPVYNRLTSSRANIPQISSITEGYFNRFISALANASYNYNNKYTVYASARRDGSNVFGVKTNNKWKPLWSAGIGWDINKELFYKIKWLPTLRLTASFGYTGNVNNNISGLPTIQYNSYVSDVSNFTYANIEQAPNPNLRWEQVEMVNIGVGFGFLNNRVTGRIEYYRKKATDLISDVPFPSSSGISSFPINASSLLGNGFEFGFRSINTQGKVRWETSFGISHSKTLITKIFREGFIRAIDFVGDGINAAQGMPAFSLASYKWAGLDPSTGVPLGYINKQVTNDYQRIYLDSVGNQVIHGSSVPLYNGLFNNSITWKNFNLSSNITYRLGFYFRRPTTSLQSDEIISSGRGNEEFSRRWRRPGDETFTNIPAIIAFGTSGVTATPFYQNSEINVLKGDNIRIQDIRLGYSLTNKKKGIQMKSLQVFVYANNLNLILWKNHDYDLDPDFVGGTSFSIPPPRSLTIGVNLNF